MQLLFKILVIQESGFDESKILKKHSLLGSPLKCRRIYFNQWQAYKPVSIFEAHKPHDIDNIVKFIDFLMMAINGLNVAYEID